MRHDPGLERTDPARRNVEARGGADRHEQGGFGPRHPHLPTTGKPFEQGGTAGGVEVRGDLVEQQDRRDSAALGDEFGMGEDEPKQQSFCSPVEARDAGWPLATWVTTRS